MDIVRVAVAYDDGNIGGHFGHAETFAVYEYNFGLDTLEATMNSVQKKLVDSSALHGHSEMAKLMMDEKIDAVLVGSMGPEARAALLSAGIIPVIGYEGPADLGADLLVLGRLPGMDGASESNCGGGCGGGCGGCGGGCGDGDGGCGCGC